MFGAFGIFMRSTTAMSCATKPQIRQRSDRLRSRDLKAFVVDKALRYGRLGPALRPLRLMIAALVRVAAKFMMGVGSPPSG